MLSTPAKPRTSAPGRRARSRSSAFFAFVMLWMLAGCGGGSGDGPAPVDPQPVLNAARPGELVAHVQSLVRARQAQRAAQGSVFDGPSLAPMLAATTSPAGDRVLRSDTTVQEPGVDEADLIKSDGQRLYTLDMVARDGQGRPLPRLRAWPRAADGSVSAGAQLNLPGDGVASPVVRGMQFDPVARRLAVLSEWVTVMPWGDPCAGQPTCLTPAMLPYFAATRSEVVVQLVDAARDGSLAAGERLVIAGRLVGTRRLGSSLIVVSTHTPKLAADELAPTASTAEREAALAAITTAQVLPTLRRDARPAQALVAETECWLQPANGSLSLEVTTITVIDLAQAAAPRSRCIVGGSEALYMSPQSLYLATTRSTYDASVDAIRYPTGMATDLHKFAMMGGLPDYRGSGTVPGHLGWDGARKPYRMSEHDGALRVLSFTGETGWIRPGLSTTQPPSPATLTVLREASAGGALQVVSQLPNARRPALLGHAGEQVHAVRFVGPRGYLVTFRQTDPLYVLDLADPADPRVAGELELPGFSDHLFPLAEGLLFGVGRDADANGVLGGVKVALFDVRDPARPAALDSRVLGARGSATGLDFSTQGLNLLEAGRTTRLALPMLVIPSGPVAPPAGWLHALQRFEVDTASRSLRSLPPVAAPGDDVYGADLWSDRSLQIGDHVYYLSGGELSASPW